MESTQAEPSKPVETTAVPEEALSVKSEEKSVMKDETEVPPQANKEEGSDETAKASTDSSKQQESTTNTLERSSWDYTNRRVIVRNVLKHMNNKDIVKMTSSWLATLSDPTSIVIEKTRKAPNQPWIQLTLEHEDMVQPFLDHLNTSKFQNRRGQVLSMPNVSNPIKTIESAKQKIDTDDGRDAKSKKSQLPKTDDQVRDVITPYWRLPYEHATRYQTEGND